MPLPTFNGLGARPAGGIGGGATTAAADSGLAVTLMFDPELAFFPGIVAGNFSAMECSC